MLKLEVILILLCGAFVGNVDMCDRRPLGTTTAPLPPDNRFIIDVIGVTEEYLPDTMYTVVLHARDNQSTFIAFTISAREDTKPNEKNPRRPIPLKPGTISPVEGSTDTQYSPNCFNTVIQSNILPKTSVNVTWRSPPKDNKCVTIYALVAVQPDVWYNYEGPLSKRVCEDRRKSDDMPPMVNDNCQVCEEARYQLTFEGLWSYNTHPQMFPTSQDLAKFSDVVGASHGNRFNVWKFNGDASEGLKMLAEQGNTTKLELEIQEKLGQDVRTIIKATGPPKPNMTTSAVFRVSQQHHLVSLVTAIQPSPDWFLGVANLELCSALGPPQWAKKIRLNLYPMDAGTDSGVLFEAPNEETSPPQPISSAVISKDIPKEKIKPFARLHFDLIRTYTTPKCAAQVTGTDGESTSESDSGYPSSGVGGGGGGGGSGGSGGGYRYNNYPWRTTTTTTSEEPITADPESSPECPVTAWEDWLPCEGECVDGNIDGMQMRLRYYLIDGAVIGKYSENDNAASEPEISEYCKENYPNVETRDCHETCETEDLSASPQRRLRKPLLPGESW